MRNCNCLTASFLVLCGLLLVLPFGGFAAEEEVPEKPITGTVLLLAEIRDFLFLFLDTDQDGRGDFWVKVGENTALAGEDEESLGIHDIVVGSQITVVEYEQGEGFIAAKAIRAAEKPDDHDGKGGGDEGGEGDDGDDKGNDKGHGSGKNDDHGGKGSGDKDEDD